MEETMKIVILTGYTKEEAGKLSEKDSRPCCYLCRRKIDSEGYYLAIDENEEFSGSQKLEFGKFGVMGESFKFQFFMCHECQLILSAIASKKLVAE